MKNQIRPTGIDLFCGAGGLSLGFEQAGFDIIAAVDLDPIHCSVYSYNFPNTKTICCDVQSLSADDLYSQIPNLKKIDLDVVFGGAPCQGFSLIGKREIRDPRNSLIKHFARLVLELKPKYFVFENVPGMAIGKHKRFIYEFFKTFASTDYKVVEDFRVLHAAEFGVPQKRKRLFLLGARNDQVVPDYPVPSFHLSGNSATNCYLTPTVGDAISDLPNIEDFDELWHQDWVKAELNLPSDYVKKLNNIRFHYGYERLYDHTLLTCSACTVHSKESRKRFSKTKNGAVEPISRFLRLDSMSLCNTLRAGTGSSNGSYTSPRPIHPIHPRCISVREAMRLHSYPDWFRVHTTKWHGFRQVGNSVPPLLAKAVASMIMKKLKNQPYRPLKKLRLGNEQLLMFSMSQAAEYFNVDCVNANSW